MLGFSSLLFDKSFASSPVGGSGAPEINPALLVADVYVNPVTGNDNNSGNATSPYKTLTKGLQRAAQFNSANQGVTVHLAPGIYLEGNPGSNNPIQFPAPTTPAPIVVQGQGWSPGVNTGDVILTGSEPWTGWNNDGGGVWSKPWPYQMPIEPGASFGDPAGTIVPEVIRLMSGLFVNDEPYYIFRSATDPDLSRLAATEGAYWIDLGPDGQRGGGDDHIRVKPPASITDLNAQNVRVTTRGNLLHFWRPSSLATQPTAIAIRNLVVQHAGGTGLVFQNHGGLIVEDMVFRHNKWRGTTIESPPSPATVRRSTYTGNGEQTIGTRGTGMLYEDLLLENNARQSYLVQYFGWGSGAFKIGESINCTFRRIRSLNNWGLGAWFDTGNVGCELVDSIIAGNSNTAIFIENNNSWNIPGLGNNTTVEVRNTVFLNNQRPPDQPGQTPGIQVGESENVVIRDCLIAGNDIQIRMNGLHDRGPQRNVQFYDNIVASTAATQPLWASQFGTAGWRTWFDTLNHTTDRNTYIHPNTNVFRDRNSSSSNLLSFSAWQTTHLNNIFNNSPNKAVDGNSVFLNATYTILPHVSIWPLQNVISENAPPTPLFRVFRLSHNISTPLTVNYTVRALAGDALNGTDFATLNGSVTIPAGQLYADITVDPINGDGTEPLEPIFLTLPSNSSYQLGKSSAFVYIDDEQGSVASVSVTAATTSTSEGAVSPGQWLFTRTGNLTHPLTVNFTISGTATPVQDFTALPSSVTFPAASATTTLALNAVDDSTPELTETVTLNLVPQLGVYGIINGSGSATIEILDNDIASTSSIVVSAPPLSSPVSVNVTLNNPAPTPTTYTISSPPLSWITLSPTSLTINAGASSTFMATLNPGPLTQGLHTTSLTVSSNNSLLPGISLPVFFTVGNYSGKLQFSSATSQISEGASTLTLQVQRLYGSSGNISASYQIIPGGNATAGADFTSVSGNISWSSGDSSNKTITIPILNDNLSEGNETFTVQILNPVGGAEIGAPDTVLVTILDDDFPLVAPPPLTANAFSQQQINLQWPSVPNATNYTLEKSTDGGVTWQTISSSLPQTTLSYQDIGLTPGATYHYRLKASNQVNSTAWSTANATTPNAGNLTITFSQNTVYENVGTIQASVSHNGPTNQALEVLLTTSNTNRASVPSSVTIPAGSNSANFNITFINDAITQGNDEQIVINAEIKGPMAKESFDYPTNSMPHGANGGFGWICEFVDIDIPKDFTILGGGLTYPGWGSSGNFAEGSLSANGSRAYRDINEFVQSGKIFIGALLQLKPATSPVSDIFIGIGNGNHESVYSMDLRFRLQANGTLDFLRTGYNSNNWNTTTLSAGPNNQGVNLLIVKLDYGPNNQVGGGDDSFTFWLNPVINPSGNEPPGGITINSTIFPVYRVGIAGWWRDARFDEIRVARTFAALTREAQNGQNQLTLKDDENLTGIAAWRNTHFGNPMDAGNGASNADPDGDGLPNLLEYALGGNPNHSAISPKPLAGLAVVGTQERITLTFTPQVLAELKYYIQVSNDLSTWTTAADVTSLLTVGTPFTYTDTVDLHTAKRRFIRLRIELDTP